MRYVSIALIVLALSLTGCAGDISKRIENAHGQTCAGLGFQRDTDAYRNCLIKLHAAAVSS